MKKSLVLFLFIFVIWTVYRYFTHFPEWVDEIVFKPILYIGPTFLLVRHFDRQSLDSLGFSKKRVLQNIGIGILVAIALISYNLLISYFKTKQLQLNFTGRDPSALLLPFIISFFTALSEEIVFRGYMFSRMLKNTQNAFVAIIVSSLVFSVIHIPRFILVEHLSTIDILMILRLYLV